MNVKVRETEEDNRKAREMAENLESQVSDPSAVSLRLCG